MLFQGGKWAAAERAAMASLPELQAEHAGKMGLVPGCDVTLPGTRIHQQLEMQVWGWPLSSAKGHSHPTAPLPAHPALRPPATAAPASAAPPCLQERPPALSLAVSLTLPPALDEPRVTGTARGTAARQRSRSSSSLISSVMCPRLQARVIRPNSLSSFFLLFPKKAFLHNVHF